MALKSLSYFPFCRLSSYHPSYSSTPHPPSPSPLLTLSSLPFMVVFFLTRVMYFGSFQKGTIFLLLFGIFDHPQQCASFFSFLPHFPKVLIPSVHVKCLFYSLRLCSFPWITTYVMRQANHALETTGNLKKKTVPSVQLLKPHVLREKGWKQPPRKCLHLQWGHLSLNSVGTVLPNRKEKYPRSLLPKVLRMSPILLLGEVPLEQWSLTLLAPGTSFMEDNFSMEKFLGWFWFWDDSSTLCYLLCILFLFGGNLRLEPAYQCRRHKKWGFNPWVRRSPGGGNGSLLQYSCLENPMDRGARWATVHGVTESQTQWTD